MTQLRRTAMVVSFIIYANHALAQDWKAQPNPQVTGQVKMNLLSDAGCRILNGFSGETDGS
ncbi:MAG: hypothetical protein KAY65_12050, partial [Planctomycetes bacterium]|nr:hypothetical protein [Planctomycetota bacterium]